MRQVLRRWAVEIWIVLAGFAAGAAGHAIWNEARAPVHATECHWPDPHPEPGEGPY